MVELLAAIVVLTIALLGLMAGYDAAFLSLHKSSSQTIASNVASNQLELYSSLPYNGLGLDTTTLTSTKSSDTLYAADETMLNSTLAQQSDATDSTILNCGSTPQCLPVQTVTGSDGRTYRVESFIRDVKVGTTWSERIVTVIVRNPNASGSPILSQLSAGFDKGPNAG